MQRWLPPRCLQLWLASSLVNLRLCAAQADVRLDYTNVATVRLCCYPMWLPYGRLGAARLIAGIYWRFAVVSAHLYLFFFQTLVCSWSELSRTCACCETDTYAEWSVAFITGLWARGICCTRGNFWAFHCKLWVWILGCTDFKRSLWLSRNFLLAVYEVARSTFDICQLLG